MMKQKALFVINGEAFRDGSHGCRSSATNESYEWQKNGTHSQIEFFDFLQKTYDLEIFISLNTYQTKYTIELISWYSDYNIIEKNINKDTNGRSVIYSATKNINTDEYDFDFIFFLRVDLFIKKKFFEVFNPHEKNIKFLFPVEWSHKTTLGKLKYNSNTNEDFDANQGKLIGKFECGYSYPLVCDLLSFWPGKHMKIFTNSEAYKRKLVFNHRMWQQLICYYDKTYDEIDFMVNSAYRANSQFCKNPYYRIVGRPESKKDFLPTKFDKFNQSL